MPDVSFTEAEPARGSHFLLSEELHAFFSLHVEVAEERIIPAIERKPGHRSGHADVDADHAALNAMLEFAGGLAGAGENGRAIAVRRAIGDFNGRIQVFEPHYI